ncbi:hypothetical protein B0H21DRAFT_416163 [Amylocystis lapponica]|nr:hypothetical protein B0H21DRAFT_416163 [Amylocystis lapponica]
MVASCPYPCRNQAGKEEEDVLAAVQQLYVYMRQVFREQLDRRFVFGLAFCATELSVWFCDRSGLIGTETTFDIHKEPKKFIQVIAALALLPPDRLGWDLSMQLYRPFAEKRFVHSWDPSVKVADFGVNAYQTYWAFDMPSRDGKTRERFISVHGLNLVPSEIICGRATLVWEVVRDDESKDETRYVLKQCWRPMSSHRESHFYEHARSDDPSASLNVGTLYSSEDVHIGGEADTTLAMLRGLTVYSNSVTDAQVVGKRDRRVVIGRFICVQTTAGGGARFSTPPAMNPNPRVLSRMLMETYGWPMKFFKDIPELLRVMRDAIIGHRTLYYRGVLHRDIGVGNIMICPEDNDEQKTHGELINLDYAASTTKFTPPIVFVGRQDWNHDAQQDYWVFPLLLRRVNITEDAFYALWIRYKGLLSEVSVYVRGVLDAKEGLKDAERPLTCEDLDIYYETMPRPDFSACVFQAVSCAATNPFSSYEITEGFRCQGVGPVEHNSIHDTEAMFWILDYLCLTRDGPGGSRRKELKRENSRGTANSLEQIVYCFFDSEEPRVRTHSRALLLHNLKDMETYIVEHFHPYFDVIKPLVLEWWRLLRCAYISGSYTPMHQPFLEVLNKTLEEIEKKPLSKQSTATLAELERRRKDLSRVREFRAMQKAAGLGQPSKPAMWTMSPPRAPRYRQVCVLSPQYREGTLKDHLSSYVHVYRMITSNGG